MRVTKQFELFINNLTKLLRITADFDLVTRQIMARRHRPFELGYAIGVVTYDANDPSGIYAMVLGWVEKKRPTILSRLGRQLRILIFEKNTNGIRGQKPSCLSPDLWWRRHDSNCGVTLVRGK